MSTLSQYENVTRKTRFSGRISDVVNRSWSEPVLLRQPCKGFYHGTEVGFTQSCSVAEILRRSRHPRSWLQCSFQKKGEINKQGKFSSDGVFCAKPNRGARTREEKGKKRGFIMLHRGFLS